MSRLAIITGPLQGRSFQLEGNLFTIGRQADNNLHIPEGSVSRRHCELRHEAGKWVLIDTGSSHGLLLNGRKILRAVLKPGDTIEIGGTRCLFLEQAHQEPAQDGFHAESTARLATDQAFFLQSSRVEAVLAKHIEVGRSLNALLALTRAINESLDPDELAETLLREVMNLTPGHRAALLLFGQAPSQPQAWHRDQGGDTTPFNISRTLRDMVCDGQAVLCENVVMDSLMKSVGSVQMLNIQSLVCVPLGSDQGILYVDSRETMDGDHLEMITAMAVIASRPLKHARDMAWLKQENHRLEQGHLEHDMIGESPAMTKVFNLLQRVAPTDSTVLVLGESGTGKELTAAAIHRNSKRAAGPFMAVNCAVLSDQLLASELFGHERGAFTGAVSRKIGKLQAAHHGTLFLDEIGELPLGLQAKLLRVLQERSFEPVGSTHTIKVDIRVIAATNRNLEHEVREGNFREDLYYRLQVIGIILPPLRERGNDIALLAHVLASRHASVLGRPFEGFHPKALAQMLAYSWPGNIRELSNAMERAMVLGVEPMVQPEDLPESVSETAPPPEGAASGYHEALNEFKARLILDAVEASDGNITKAAGTLEIHPNYLHRLISNLGLRDAIKKKGD